MKKRTIYILFIALFGFVPGFAQDSTDVGFTVEPVEPQYLQGPREATDMEKEYARQLEQDRREQEQIDMNLPIVDENGQVVTPASDYYYPFWDGYGWNSWRLHKGLNVNLSASAFVTSGKGLGTHGGFSQDVSLMYVTNLSKKATLAVGGYLNNLESSGNNYFTGGISALFGYRFDEHWSAYAFVQKAFTSNNLRPSFGYYAPYGGYFGYAPVGYGSWDSRFMDRVGGGVTYQWGKYNQNFVTIEVEIDHVPDLYRGYDYRHYDYPVRY